MRGFTTTVGFGAALACAVGWGVGVGCGGKSGGNESGGDGGSSSGGGSGSSSGSSSGGTSADASSGDDAGSPLSGTYKGYIQSFMFPDGTDTVVMTLAFAADGTVTGTVFFGTGPVLAPPTNPNVGYPPGLTGGLAGANLGSPALLEGFEFTVLAGTYAAPRLQLQIEPAQLWKQWCQLQTSYPQYNGAVSGDDGGGGDDDGGCGAIGRYGCLPNVGFSEGASGCTISSCQEPMLTAIDCGKLSLCSGFGVCTCTATSCTVPLGTPAGVSFDMQLSAGTLNGSETGISASGTGGSQVLNVILTKQ